MAYSGYSGGNVGEPYDYEFAVAPSQYPSPPYDLPQTHLLHYTPSTYYTYNDDHHDYSFSAYSEPIKYHDSYDYYDYSANQSQTNHYYVEPKYLRHDPPPHHQLYFPSQTKFTISYSNVEMKPPEFPEYDPTPYDGGYDQRLTYGKPLPPSDLTCYPRSLPQPDSPSLANFSYNSIPSPYGKDDDIPLKPSNKESKPIDTTTDTTQSDAGDGGQAIDVVEPRDAEIPSGDYRSLEHQNGFPRVDQIPYGSGLEAMDICESLFGYWPPCVAKKAMQEQRNLCPVCNHFHDHDRRRVEVDPWTNAADYIFGGPLPYDHHNYHHHQQSAYQYEQASWLQ